MLKYNGVEIWGGNTEIKIRFEEGNYMKKSLIPMDCHNHSNLSPDGINSPEEMVVRACELGIEYYSLTDHLEINKFYDEEYLYEEPVKTASITMPKLIKKYSDKLNIAYGVELGQPLQDMALTNRMLSSYKYDFIIGSLHMCEGWDDFYLLDYNEVKPDKILKLYFEEMLEMVKWGGFDTLGHLTYPLRYMVGESGLYVDMSKFLNIIREIYSVMIKNDIALEINSSGLRQKIGLTLPDEYYIRLYRELGGRLLTVGSDAHCTEDLGKGIEKAIQLAREVGFNELTFFKNRKPVLIPIG